MIVFGKRNKSKIRTERPKWARIKGGSDSFQHSSIPMEPSFHLIYYFSKDSVGS